MDSISIVHEETITIKQGYYAVKASIQEKLSEWIDMYIFVDADQRIKFKTEGPLIPDENLKRPILILLSNPHPHSVKQGMFLSPNRIGRSNPFWETLRDTGFFKYDGEINAMSMIKNEYQSPFRFFMAVLSPFPTEDPTHLINFFGVREYNKMIEESKDALKKLIMNHKIMDIVCFGKTQYDIIKFSNNISSKYISVLKNGEIIQDKIWFSKDINVYLTFPTGWRFAKNHRSLKARALKNLFHLIIDKSIETL